MKHLLRQTDKDINDYSKTLYHRKENHIYTNSIRQWHWYGYHQETNNNGAYKNIK